MIHHKGTMVEHRGGTKIRFTCPEGHRKTVDYSKVRRMQRMGEFGCRFMVRYWKDRMSYDCKRCDKKATETR